MTIKVTAFRLPNPLTIDEFLAQKDSFESFSFGTITKISFQGVSTGRPIILKCINPSEFSSDRKYIFGGNVFGIIFDTDNDSKIYCIGIFTERDYLMDDDGSNTFKFLPYLFHATGKHKALSESINRFLDNRQLFSNK